MIEQTSINDISPLTEAEQLRKEKIAAKRRAWRERKKKYIKKCCCQDCGQPKHYVCLQHHPFKKTEAQKFFGKPLKRIYYYSKKLYFNLMKKLRFIE